MNTPDPLNDPRFEQLVSRLRSQEVPTPSADFTARTMARLHGPAARRRKLPAIALRAVAALAGLCNAGLWFIRTPAPMAKSPAPVDILMAAQRPDGGWSADERNPRHRYDTSVTALALLALIQDDPSPLQGPATGAIRAGMAHLLRQQQSDGCFGDNFSGAGFTQYLAGMALQTAARLPGADPAWIAAAARARRHLPSNLQMAKLNANLAHPGSFPIRWADAGGPVAHTAIEMLEK
ncbi:MAG TPA: hypothetical protein DCM68_02840 [Verrucomicrobia bacterium]|nr:hypothetical protein [Verrucomicrobiota bacterium]